MRRGSIKSRAISSKGSGTFLRKRDAVAADPLEALDFTGPPAFSTTPELPSPAITLNLSAGSFLAVRVNPEISIPKPVD